MVFAPGPPPCCTGCAEYDRADGICRLLAEPSLENRQRLLTMPCNVQRLLAQRFRAYGEDVVSETIVEWLNPERHPDDIAASYGRTPRDARMWLSSWPYLYLARNAIRRVHRDAGRFVASDRDAPLPQVDPTTDVRVDRALERVHRIDPTGYSMLADLRADRFDAGRWAQALGCADATVTDRKYLAIYRYSVYFHEIVESISPHDAAVALVTRRLSPGDPTERSSLDSARLTLGNPSLSLADFRKLYRDGASQSLTLLEAREALGPEMMDELGTAFRRVLRID